MADPSTNTTYTPSGVNMTAQGSPFGFTGAGMPDLNAVVRFAQMLALQQMKMKQDQFDLQKSQLQRQNDMQDTDRDRARAEQLKAVMQGGGNQQGQAYYLKPMTGFNMSGGYARASAGDPGAVFGGYLPQGSLPQSAGMAIPPHQSPANLTPSAPQQQFNQPEDTLAERYFKQFGRLPGAGTGARPSNGEGS